MTTDIKEPDMTDTESLEDLGRRAVVAGWNWRKARGALIHGTWCRVVEQQRFAEDIGRSHTWVLDGFTREWRLTTDEDIPDLTDPATLGCLLALVREAIGQTASTRCTTPGLGYWIVEKPGGDEITGEHDSEAHALVAALERAP